MVPLRDPPVAASAIRAAMRCWLPASPWTARIRSACPDTPRYPPAACASVRLAGFVSLFVLRLQRRSKPQYRGLILRPSVPALAGSDVGLLRIPAIVSTDSGRRKKLLTMGRKAHLPPRDKNGRLVDDTGRESQSLIFFAWGSARREAHSAKARFSSFGADFSASGRSYSFFF